MARQTNARTIACDTSNPQHLQWLFQSALPKNQPLEVVIYNPHRTLTSSSSHPIADVDPHQVQQAVEYTARGSYAVGCAAAARMKQGGTILLTAASAGSHGFPRSTAFDAAAKYAQRNVARYMAEQLQAHNVRVCWINVDGGIQNLSSMSQGWDADGIADTYVSLVRQQQQHSSTCSEVTLKSLVRRF